jgi:peptidoglycan hydrolase CwlO-like protein
MEKDIIKNLKERQKALKEQSKSLPESQETNAAYVELYRKIFGLKTPSQSFEDIIWETEINAKLDLLEELLEELRK